MKSVTALLLAVALAAAVAIVGCKAKDQTSGQEPVKIGLAPGECAPVEPAPLTPAYPPPAQAQPIYGSGPVTEVQAEPFPAPTMTEPATPAVKRTTTAKKSVNQSYTVKKGDNLAKISKKFYGTEGRVKDIVAANKQTISDPNKLKIGQVIKLP